MTLWERDWKFWILCEQKIDATIKSCDPAVRSYENAAGLVGAALQMFGSKIEICIAEEESSKLIQPLERDISGNSGSLVSKRSR